MSGENNFLEIFFETWPHGNRMSCAILRKALKTEGITSQGTFLPFFPLVSPFFDMNEIEIYFVVFRVLLRRISFSDDEERVALGKLPFDDDARRTLDMFIREIANTQIDDNRKMIVSKKFTALFSVSFCGHEARKCAIF